MANDILGTLKASRSGQRGWSAWLVRLRLRRSSKFSSKSPRVATAAILVGFAVLLELITRFGLVSPIVLVAPDQMLVSLFKIAATGELFVNLWHTSIAVLISVSCAIIVGVGAALLLWRMPIMQTIFEPYLVGLYAMPLILFYPFALAIFGLGTAPIIIIAATMGVVPVILNSVAAFKQIPDIYFRVGRVLGCSPITRFFRISLPAAAPLVFAGFKLCLIYTFIGVIVMEFMTGNIGLGYQIANNYNSFNISEMYAYVLVVITLAAVIVTLFRYGERWLRREGG